MMRKMHIRDFSQSYYRAYSLSCEYVAYLALDILEKANITCVLAHNFISVGEIIKRFNFIEKAQIPLAWMLDFLNIAGLVEKKDDIFYKLKKANKFDVEKKAQEILQNDPTFIYSNNLLKIVCDNYLDFLKGKKSGEEILFSSEATKSWIDYFGDLDSPYSIYNILGAENLEKWCLAGNDKKVFLELGSGSGGGTIFLLKLLQEHKRMNIVSRYIFSDLSPLLLKFGERSLRKHFDFGQEIIFKKINFDESIIAQGLEKNSVDVVYAVNAIHAARNIFFTLNEIKKVLKKGGSLILSEGIRSRPGKPMFQEIIFNLLENYRNVEIDQNFRPTHGCLDSQNWHKLFQKSNFCSIETVNNVNDKRGTLPDPFYDNSFAMVIKGINL